jgi:multidrug efflux pump subunit AcrB
LPNSASLERTSQAATQIENILASTPGVKYTTSVIGFSLLSFVRTSYNAFFVVTLKPWDERTTRAEQFQAIKAHLNQQLTKLPASRLISRVHRSVHVHARFGMNTPTLCTLLIGRNTGRHYICRGATVGMSVALVEQIAGP